VRTDQVSQRAGRIVYQKILGGSSTPYSGCGIAGCTSGYRSSTEAGIAVANLDGTGEQQLTSGGYDIDPTFSPDGTTIAFLRHTLREGYGEVDVIALMTPAGTVTGVIEPEPGYSYQSPVWSPDGRNLAAPRVSTSVPAEQPGASGIFVIPVDGREPVEVAEGAYRQLAWSHNELYLAGVRVRYMRYGSRSTWEPGDHLTGEDVWIIPIDGSPPTNVTNVAPSKELSADECGAYGGVLVRATNPMWSSDDSMLAILTNVEHTSELGEPKDVAVANADGTDLRIVFQGPATDCATGSHPALTLLGWR
jgi:Tol biopolymer transport system component